MLFQRAISSVSNWPTYSTQEGKSALDLTTQEEIRTMLRAYRKLLLSDFWLRFLAPTAYILYRYPILLPPFLCSGAHAGSTIRNKDELCHAVKKEDVDAVRELLALASTILDVNVQDEVTCCVAIYMVVLQDSSLV